MENYMRAIVTVVGAALLAITLGLPATAATSKDKDPAMKEKQASCQKQANKKYSAVHFLKRRAYVKKCMGEA